MANTFEKDIKVIITAPTIQTDIKTPTIQQNLNVSVPVFPTTDNVINVSEENEFVNYTNQTQINEYLNQKIRDLDLENTQQLTFVGQITEDITTTDLLNQAIALNGALYPGNFWIAKIDKFDEVAITNVSENPDYDLRNQEGDLIPNGESTFLKNQNWVIYTNKKEFQKLDLNTADASAIILDTTNFNNLLGPEDNTVQAAMDTIDNHRHDADEIDYISNVHNLITDVKQNLDGIWHFLSFVNLYVNGGQSTSNYYTNSAIDGGSSATVVEPNSIMNAGFSQEYNKEDQD
jgi:hypothetical protein